MGTIFDIQHFSIHDGPGIRTTVFLKGCNNRCLWCHNPESYEIDPQIQLYPEKCIGCGQCFKLCPHACHVMEPSNAKAENNGKGAERKFLKNKCTGCGLCAGNCFAKALALCGEEKSTEEILNILLADKKYYEQSGGGVTVSGGEPFFQFEFLMELIQLLKKNDIHITVQTALNVDFDLIVEAAPYVDIFMCDFKLFDEDLNKKYIGNDGRRIKENFKRLSEVRKYGCEIIVRTPVIGGINDNKTEIKNIKNFLNQYVGSPEHKLLPYHNLGEAKKDQTVQSEENIFFKTPSKERIEELNRL